MMGDIPEPTIFPSISCIGHQIIYFARNPTKGFHLFLFDTSIL